LIDFDIAVRRSLNKLADCQMVSTAFHSRLIPKSRSHTFCIGYTFVPVGCRCKKLHRASPSSLRPLGRFGVLPLCPRTHYVDL
jgi:hypothetical protein